MSAIRGGALGSPEMLPLKSTGRLPGTSLSSTRDTRRSQFPLRAQERIQEDEVEDSRGIRPLGCSRGDGEADERLQHAVS